MVVGYNFLIFLFFYHLGNAIGFNTIRMRSMSSIIYFTHILVIMIVEMAFLMIKGQYKGYESPIFAITIILLIIYSYMMTANKRVFTQIKKVLY